jgi:hypothetical protein
MRNNSEPDVNALLLELLTRLQETLGPSLLGLYLYGSLVAGDFDPDISDIDLLAVLASDLTDEQFRSLDLMHHDFVHVHPAWDDRLDIAYISAPALRGFGTQSTILGIISPGEPFHVIEADPGWLLNWYAVQEQGRTLLGPSPETFIRSISKDEFVQAVRGQARNWPAWLEHSVTRKSRAYAVLTMCRALYAHTYREQVSKHRAAAWAQGELPEWSSLIQDALQWRSAWRDYNVDHAATYPETERFVRFATNQILRR